MPDASSTPQKILFVNHTGMVSGAERVLLVILDHLDRTRYEATVACPPETQLAQLVESRGIRFVSLPHVRARFTWNPFRLARYFRSYFNSIREFRQSPELRTADIIHATACEQACLPLLRPRDGGARHLARP